MEEKDIVTFFVLILWWAGMTSFPHPLLLSFLICHQSQFINLPPSFLPSFLFVLPPPPDRENILLLFLLLRLKKWDDFIIGDISFSHSIQGEGRRFLFFFFFCSFIQASIWKEEERIRRFREGGEDDTHHDFWLPFMGKKKWRIKVNLVLLKRPPSLNSREEGRPLSL